MAVTTASLRAMTLMNRAVVTVSLRACSCISMAVTTAKLRAMTSMDRSCDVEEIDCVGFCASCKALILQDRAQEPLKRQPKGAQSDAKGVTTGPSNEKGQFYKTSAVL